MCSPSLSIDVVARDEDNLFVVQRVDDGKTALPGGFVEIGETIEEAVRREM